MLKSVEKCGMVIGQEYRIQQSSQYCNLISGFHNIVCEFEQIGLSLLKSAISRLQGQNLGDMEI